MATRRNSPVKPEEIEPQMCSIDTRHKVLSQVPFFSQLSADEIAAINALFREQGYQPGQSIYFAGEPATRLYVVAAGKVKVIRHTLSGQDVLLDILIPGDFFGSLSVLGDEEYQDTTEAQTNCCVLATEAETFQTILQRYPSVAVSALEMVAHRLQAAHDTIRQLSAYSVDQRIASTLLKLAEKVGEQQPEGLLIQLPLSRQDLADMTGTTIETASRVMSQFQKEGLVRTGRQWVAITDQAGLAALIAND